MDKHRIYGALALVLLLGAALPTAAWAGESSASQVPDNVRIDVRAKMEDGAETPVRYFVEVEWGAMEFTYTVAGESVWNPKTHEYEVTEKNEWSGNGNTITVKNHSNAAVEAKLSFKAADGYDLTGSFDKPVLKLSTAEGTAPAEAPSDTTEFMLSGTMDAATDTYHTVGQITVAVD